MLEVTREDWMARLAALRSEEFDLSTPEILYISTDGAETPDYARARVSDSESETGSKNVLMLRPSRFFTGGKSLGGGIDPGYRGADIAHEPDSAGIAAIWSRDAEAPSDKTILPVGDALLLSRSPRKFAKFFIGLRNRVGPEKLIYAPGLADPLNLSLLCYLGIDLVDSFGTIVRSSNGQVILNNQVVGSDSEELERIPGVGLNPDTRKITEHNLRMLENELAVVRDAIRHGTLRQLVELRARASAWMIEALRFADLDEFAAFEQWVPVNGGEFMASSKESLWRPDIRRYRVRVNEAYSPPPSPEVLVLMPCSAKKPYSLSRTHKAFRNAIWNSGLASSVYEVIVTSPLGVVPRDLEIVYPAQQYDIPVTGHWDEDEKAIIREMLVKLLSKRRYSHVVAHLDSEYEFLKDLLDGVGAIHTGKDNVNSRESLTELEKALSSIKDDVHRIDWGKKALEDIRALASYQFGDAAGPLLDGAIAKGNYPMIKMFRDYVQLCSLVQDKGGLSLTLEGGISLSRTGRFGVEIDDFAPKTNVFAIGVIDASPEIRIGDEVFVHHKGDVRAVGTARMNGRSMVAHSRGEAVHIRHHS